MDAVPENSVAAGEFCTSDRNHCEVRRTVVRRWPVGGAGSEERPLRVLVVDDDRDAADSLSRLVRRWGHDAQCAYDGAAALELAASIQVDVVLLDVALPRVDGGQLASRLRAGAASGDCLLIAVTALAGDRHRRLCYQAGFDLFLVKPVEAEVIEMLLLLERKRLRLMPARPLQLGPVLDTGRAVADGVMA